MKFNFKILWKHPKIVQLEGRSNCLYIRFFFFFKKIIQSLVLLPWFRSILTHKNL